MSRHEPAAAGPELSPREIWNDLWRRLGAGAGAARHPFHLGTLATAADGVPDQRTVVLRAVDARHHMLLFHTDARSPKVAALRTNPEVCWLFYDARARLQLRIACRASLHLDGPLREARWRASRLSSRACYVHRHGPGTALSHPLEYGPVQPADHDDPDAVTAPGRDNFAVVATVAHRVEWLSLSHRGHRRLVFKVTPLGFDSRWIAP